jgi:hypothetical protein
MNIEHRTLNVQHRIMNSVDFKKKLRNTRRKRLRLRPVSLRAGSAARANLPNKILRSLDHIFSVIRLF